MLLLGVLQAQAAGAGVAGSFDLLETQVLGTAVASVTFSSLSTYAADYQHLQIRMVAQGPGSLSMRFNGVTSSGSYKDHRLFGFNSNVASDTIFTDQMYLGAISNTAGNLYSPKVIDILDPFKTTKNTTVRTMSGRTEVSPFIIEFISGLFISTAAVNSINIFGLTNIAIGSRFSLYGVKGSA